MKRIFSLPFLLLVLGSLLLSNAVSAQKLFTVTIAGKGTPLILIPGLYCNGSVWDETVAHYKDNYECHVVTLAGFGTPPALRDNFLEGVKDELIEYTKTKKLKNAIIMGHSTGGFLAMWAAASAPDLFGKVISVDGLPFLAAVQMPGATAESIKPMATNMRNTMTNQTPEQTVATQQRILPSLILSQENIGRVATMASKCDPATQGQVMYELYTTDLRPVVSSITRPVLMLGAWIGYKDYGVTREGSLVGYKSQTANIANCTIALSDVAKHFIFFDDPAWFFATVDAFLK